MGLTRAIGRAMGELVTVANLYQVVTLRLTVDRENYPVNPKRILGIRLSKRSRLQVTAVLGLIVV
jgi:hypothetical protein